MTKKFLSRRERKLQIDGLAQDRSNSSALAMELLQVSHVVIDM